MTPLELRAALLTRRQFFGRTVGGLGAVALDSLLRPARAATDGRVGLPHFPPKAKRVIYLLQSGAPSHVDLFDYKQFTDQWLWCSDQLNPACDEFLMP